MSLSREEVHDFVRAMTTYMQTPSFVEKLREAVKREPAPTSDTELMALFEGLQEEFLASYASTRKRGANEQEAEGATAAARDGAATLQQLREAVLHFPDKETEGMIRQMCMLQESQMVSICASTPSLASLLRGGGEGHHHDHDHGHCHGHCHGHGAPNPQEVMEMQMAFQSLPPHLRQEMMRIQQLMQSGQPPRAEDAEKMREINSHLKAFITTLRQFSGSNEAAKK
ncbi:uncharacterized protein Tco025E_00308 [Trypanosoma conorhini]|uniref:Uncharacterized protein n=1 Tax=Trypanosoma conorhini TaxID=83891 RepID=A0A3R7M6E9_9TRYP|nr:uncharacterized protein Tco025E_00308 [Trypanosoma conorhini]RNF27446.1 hypothetical protein Tco025E_00308 [Trypanosoma conorhini]